MSKTEIKIFSGKDKNDLSYNVNQFLLREDVKYINALYQTNIHDLGRKAVILYSITVVYEIIEVRKQRSSLLSAVDEIERAMIGNKDKYINDEYLQNAIRIIKENIE